VTGVSRASCGLLTACASAFSLSLWSVPSSSQGSVRRLLDAADARHGRAPRGALLGTPNNLQNVQQPLDRPEASQVEPCEPGALHWVLRASIARLPFFYAKVDKSVSWTPSTPPMPDSRGDFDVDHSSITLVRPVALYSHHTSYTRAYQAVSDGFKTTPKVLETSQKRLEVDPSVVICMDFDVRAYLTCKAHGGTLLGTIWWTVHSSHSRYSNLSG
jgi:hypothetical protein